MENRVHLYLLCFIMETSGCINHLDEHIDHELIKIIDSFPQVRNSQKLQILDNFGKSRKKHWRSIFTGAMSGEKKLVTHWK
jgi:hypothetical protein